MLKPIILLVSLFLATNACHAATSLQLEPTNGSVAGRPGDTVGWGFLLTNTQNYLVVTGAEFQSSHSPGLFTDFISAPDNFFVVGPGFGASSAWAQSFDITAQTGIGSFRITDDAGVGSYYGQIVLTYDLFSRNPVNPLFDPDVDTLSTGNMLAANIAVTVTSVPLPATVWLFSGALMVMVGALRRRPAI